MDMENTFAKKVQKAMGSAIPDWIPRGKWRGVSYGHILTDMRNNFIDGCYPVKCCIREIYRRVRLNIIREHHI